MALKVYKADDPFEVSAVSICIHGVTGGGKTSMAMTGKNPFTFCFDKGIYRAFKKRGSYGTLTSWDDIAEADVTGFSPIVVDTGTNALRLLEGKAASMGATYTKKSGALNFEGYRLVLESFRAWVNKIHSQGSDVVYLTQSKTLAPKGSDEEFTRPDIMGGSYNMLMQDCDAVGYLHYVNGKRFLDFAPCDSFMAKMPKLDNLHIEVPHYAQEPNFLDKLLTDIKAGIGQIAKANEKLNTEMDDWKAWIDSCPSVEDVNEHMVKFVKLKQAVKVAVWAFLKPYAEAQGWKLDRKTNKYYEAEEAGVPE